MPFEILDPDPNVDISLIEALTKDQRSENKGLLSVVKSWFTPSKESKDKTSLADAEYIPEPIPVPVPDQKPIGAIGPIGSTGPTPQYHFTDYTGSAGFTGNVPYGYTGYYNSIGEEKAKKHKAEIALEVERIRAETEELERQRLMIIDEIRRKNREREISSLSEDREL